MHSFSSVKIHKLVSSLLTAVWSQYYVSKRSSFLTIPGLNRFACLYIATKYQSAVFIEDMSEYFRGEGDKIKSSAFVWTCNGFY